MLQQQCNKCLIIKDLNLFDFRKDRNKYRNRCKDCTSAYNSQYRKTNRSKRKSYNETNKEHIRKKNKEWYIKNKNHVLNKTNEYKKFKYKNDIQYRMRRNIRDRLRKYLNSSTKPTSIKLALGCSTIFLTQYLENKFQDGMSWENYGEWHIDHIKPLVSFDLTNEEQFKQACHYTNLQPLWAEDNLRKGSKTTS